MKSLRIGITGGIGSGKSLVCKIFSLLGAPIYDADSRAKKLMTEDQVLVKSIKEKFGSQSYLEDGSLNRAYLSDTVFNNSEQLQILNGLVHPRVAIDGENWFLQNQTARYAIKEAALLFESGAYKALDKIIVVTAPEDLRIQRVLNRDHERTRAAVEKIIHNQISETEKISRADFVIINDEQQLVIPQVLKLHERFVSALEI
ncbi:MAG TPA: dephospho-CoA kinase [Cytophagales bacterium]|jgi:dephospho-CoA kinase|nr:dephospho-CoA kinase [Cytophagales bacterium]